MSVPLSFLGEPHRAMSPLQASNRLVRLLLSLVAGRGIEPSRDYWSQVQESNPHLLLTKQRLYH